MCGRTYSIDVRGGEVVRGEFECAGTGCVEDNLRAGKSPPQVILDGEVASDVLCEANRTMSAMKSVGRE